MDRATSNFFEKEHLFQNYGIFWVTLRDFLSNFSGDFEHPKDRAS